MTSLLVEAKVRVKPRTRARTNTEAVTNLAIGMKSARNLSLVELLSKGKDLSMSVAMLSPLLL